jgi:VWFA-related protein
MLKIPKNKLAFFSLLCISLVFLTGFSPVRQSLPAQQSSSAQQGEPESGTLTARITQVDTSQFPKVTVYVSVTDANGEPVGVSVSKLVLRENGEIMTPEDISGAGEIGPLTTMLVMDVSGSMNHAGKLESAKDAARAYVDQSRPQDYVGLLAFNTQTDYVQPLTSDHQKLSDAIESLKADEDTAMYDALVVAMELLEAIQGRVAVIALTDGLDNRSKISPQEVIQMIGPEGLSISTIGLGEPTHSTSALSGLNEPALKAFSEQAGGMYGYANDAESLQALYKLYGRALQSEYVIAYTSPSQLRDGVNRALTVMVSDQEDATGAVAASAAEGEQELYNPGGLVPEVAEPASWSIFFILLVALVLLLLVPTLIFFVLRFFRGRQKGKVKVKNSPTKKARVKLKS